MTMKGKTMMQDRTYSTGEVTKFADVSNANLQNWLKRGAIVGQRGIEGGGGNGLRRRFNHSSLMEITTAAALIDLGIPLTDAFAAAVRFSHTGDGGAGWGGDDDKLTQMRTPGYPFHHDLGDTFLFVAGDRSAIVLSKDGTVNLRTVAHSLGEVQGMVVLNMSEIFGRVVNRMGEDARVMLDAVYKELGG
jgi:hypothetical protein